MDETGAMSNTTGGRKAVYVDWKMAGCFLKSLNDCLEATGDLNVLGQSLSEQGGFRFGFRNVLSVGVMPQ